jgi:hypothetical protein
MHIFMKNKMFIIFDLHWNKLRPIMQAYGEENKEWNKKLEKIIFTNFRIK